MAHSILHFVGRVLEKLVQSDLVGLAFIPSKSKPLPADVPKPGLLTDHFTLIPSKYSKSHRIGLPLWVIIDPPLWKGGRVF